MIIETLANPDALAHRAAEWLLERVLATHKPFAIALSGGETPRALYALMASPAFRERFPWERIHWFWGDERFVAHDDPRSNYRMAYDALLAHIPVPPANIHAFPVANVDPAQAAAQYESDLKSFYGAARLDPARPLFDVVLLGLGEDGHTASLFPGTDVLAEQSRWAAAVIGAKAEPRLTLTYPALNSTRHAVFLVSGAAKCAMLERLIAGDPALPAAHIAPHGETRVFADLAAHPDLKTVQP